MSRIDEIRAEVDLYNRNGFGFDVEQAVVINDIEYLLTEVDRLQEVYKQSFNNSIESYNGLKRIEPVVKATVTERDCLREENAQLRKERDAAVEDIKDGVCCATCAHFRPKTETACNVGGCISLHKLDRWKWRGPCAENGGNHE